MQYKDLDLRELSCPGPLKAVEDELASMMEGVLTVLVRSGSRGNIERFARLKGMKFNMAKKGDHYELKIVKTKRSKPKKKGLLDGLAGLFRANAPVEGLRDTMLIISNYSFGGREDIGETLMQVFFETMKVTEDLPGCIFFINSGVMLTTVEDGLIPLLGDFESRGVEIYTCGTCLKHFKLEDRLRVGEVGSMAVLTDGMRNFKKIMTV